MSDKRKRRAVVTGAASGIGQAVLRRLLREGVDVLAVDIAADRLPAKETPGVTSLVANVADPKDRERIASAAAGFDFLVNAAGIIRVKSIFEVTESEWREIMAINVESVFFLCQAIGPKMAAGGAIVNLSSSSAKLASTVETTPYAATKTAILSITRSFAYALIPYQVRVNAICPGVVDTPLQERLIGEVAQKRGVTSDQFNEQRNKWVPMGRPATADECAGAIWFLLSDDSTYMTGEAMNFAGGLVMW